MAVEGPAGGGWVAMSISDSKMAICMKYVKNK